MTKPLVLCILDGVGINTDKNHNAVAQAKMPFLNELFEKYPDSKLDASGAAVGLPENVIGNSEVGHSTIGSGRIINQFLRRFLLEDWNKNKPLNDFILDIKNLGGIVHVIGMMSDGRVHSDINEIILITKRILKSGLKVCIHFISDGRDTLAKSASVYIGLIKKELGSSIESGDVFFGTLSGRYYSMDRNQNLDRTQVAFDAIANIKSEHSSASVDSALTDAYNRGESDEFIKPIIISGAVPITEKDGILFGNYRSDRARQILRMLLKTNARMLCFSEYGGGLNDSCPALLTEVLVKNTLGEVLSAAGKRQLRIAETEKYNHVTYFFDAERDIDFPGEEKVLIPSPDVATFDLKPEMSAPEITHELLLRLSEFDVVILNYANGDMVGHTGNESATILAMECLDKQLAQIVPAVLNLGGTILITADHGNAEKMWDKEDNSPWTAHTTNQVNFIVVSNTNYSVKDGGLSDIAPTILKILNLPQPSEMTGHSLID
ncbi:MAG: 2,3-bisphosphoglycerate-independent phosphoglycerate mutase [Alphaproteobacteria bacterium]|nr:2,3-bisphosphoglycerate-independent phosphoglycerate mutase [Alphaproteobacteria bacterium]MBN2675246.1 2,3-bisphosphoglycerate-independent phosphoglycerate mutase [Alphaproteobacteria bacterium]